MTLTLYGEVRFNGAQAKGEIEKVKVATTGIKDESGKAAGEVSHLRKEVQALKSALTAQKLELKGTKQRLNDYKTQMAPVGQASATAAGQVGNLTAQFNDIGMMLMAGQNPLQLAVQQGTQITQVIGPLGAGGAVRALGTAFLSLLSPINLVTLGVIAGGAALVQWFTEAGDEVASFDDALADLKATSDRLAASDGLAAAPLAAIAEYRNLIGVINEVDQVERRRAAEAVVRATGIADAIVKNLSANSVATQLGLDEIEFEFFGLDHISEANFLLDRTREIIMATGDEQARLIDSTAEALRMRGILNGEAKALLATISNELGITDRLVKSTEDRVKSEREAAKQMREAQAAVEQLRIAADALPGVLQGSAVFAGSLAEQLWNAARGMAAIYQNYSPLPESGGRGGDPRQFTHTDEFRRQLEDQANWKKPGTGRVGGGRASAHDAESEALARLISAQEQQLAILRETDPVQREMLRYRDLMRGATDSERAAIERLIGTRLREEEAMRGVKDQERFFRDIAGDTVRGLINDVDDLGDVFDRLASRIADAALEAALFGEGPLANLFGGGGGLFGFITDAVVPKAATGGYLVGPGGGTSDQIPMFGSSGEFMVNASATARHRPLLEAINSGAPVPGFAMGGMVAPPLPYGGAAAPAQGGVQGRLLVTIAPGPEFDARVTSTSQDVAIEVVREYDASQLPASVQRISDDPRATY
ncbi:phage tail length tape measure family protein [Sedimentitalea sp. JM2-8]|uniref:Phage tail length tape measure family protein n=1 Tax=Sedimentitalea xiamensis TaxID=3050037 RepID=A0ABT7FCD2_9RHOB|nr:phage tail length tape measure family protein [Sedimentitalea xiamensis]MDK3072772.1 phage tail length tape measure family protein [Sedimentitalea xiamensis]